MNQKPLNLPTLEIKDFSVKEGQDAIFTIGTSSAAYKGNKLRLTVANGTAIAPGDFLLDGLQYSIDGINYLPFTNGSEISFEPGTDCLYVRVRTVDDNVVDANLAPGNIFTDRENFTLTATPVAGFGGGAVIGNALILDDDVQKISVVSNGDKFEGEFASWTVSVDKNSDYKWSWARFNLLDGTTDRANDYDPSTLQVSIDNGTTWTQLVEDDNFGFAFKPGLTSAQVRVKTNTDTRTEGSESLILKVSPNNEGLGHLDPTMVQAALNIKDPIDGTPTPPGTTPTPPGVTPTPPGVTPTPPGTTPTPPGTTPTPPGTTPTPPGTTPTPPGTTPTPPGTTPTPPGTTPTPPGTTPTPPGTTPTPPGVTPTPPGTTPTPPGTTPTPPGTTPTPPGVTPTPPGTTPTPPGTTPTPPGTTPTPPGVTPTPPGVTPTPPGTTPTPPGTTPTPPGVTPTPPGTTPTPPGTTPTPPGVTPTPPGTTPTPPGTTPTPPGTTPTPPGSTPTPPGTTPTPPGTTPTPPGVTPTPPGTTPTPPGTTPTPPGTTPTPPGTTPTPPGVTPTPPGTTPTPPGVTPTPPGTTPTPPGTTPTPPGTTPTPPGTTPTPPGTTPTPPGTTPTPPGTTPTPPGTTPTPPGTTPTPPGTTPTPPGVTPTPPGTTPTPPGTTPKAKLVGDNMITEGAAGSYRVELDAVSDRDRTFTITIANGTANRIDANRGTRLGNATQPAFTGNPDSTLENQQVAKNFAQWGDIFWRNINTEPNGYQVRDDNDFTVTNSSGSLNTGNTITVTVRAGQQNSDAFRIDAWKENVISPWALLPTQLNANESLYRFGGQENIYIGTGLNSPEAALQRERDETLSVTLTSATDANIHAADSKIDVTIKDASLINYISPIALDLNNDGVQTVSVDAGVKFDILNSGTAVRTGWISGEDGFLAIDRNGNGSIDDRSELFGGAVGEGFGTLASFDSNADGAVDATDEFFTSLGVWRDTNVDGVTNTGEFTSLADAGIAKLNTAYSSDFSTDAQGNILGEKSNAITTSGNSIETVDVYFRLG